MNETTARFLPARFFQAGVAEADPELNAAIEEHGVVLSDAG